MFDVKANRNRKGNANEIAGRGERIFRAGENRFCAGAARAEEVAD